jgi:YD repeat-containing protein
MKEYQVVVVAAFIALPSVAQAAETIAYSYDARGRLVKVVRTGTVNNNVQVVYTHDKANNRKTVVVTGSSNPPS